MTALFVALAVIALVAAIAAYGASSWKSEAQTVLARLDATRVQVEPEAVDFSKLESLPAPVQRYLRAVLSNGAPILTGVHLAHRGEFNMGENDDRWKPFTSDQRVVLRRPGFVWDARIRMMPGLNVFVRDAYVAGEGMLAAKILGFVKVMEQPSTPELAQGELMRFLAESAWYPTVLLPGQGVRWEAIDDQSAAALLYDGETSVKLTFGFDAQGYINTVYSDARFREVSGVQTPTPWQGRFRDYRSVGGIYVPFEGEVAWLLEQGEKPYWRGRIVGIEYEFASETPRH